MNFKKKVNGSWVDTPNYIHKTDTDTFTTLPADLYPTGTTATVGSKGNTVQSGTPSPDNPIMPNGTGDKTANLFIQKLTGASIDSAGKITSDANYDTYIAEVSNGETYTVSNVTGTQVFGFFTTIPTLSTITYNSSRTIFSTPSQTLTVPTGENIKYIGVRYNTGVSNEMLNTGSTALPYEPYGYKIPISCGGTTTPVYLGEVETTREIKKLVFTGNETIGAYDSTYNRFSIIIPDSLIIGVRLSPVICSHYQAISDGRGIANVPNNAIYSDSGSSRWFIKTTEYTNDTDFKTYLTQQYAAGTPVCVWYVLATPTTGIVNEPLMKIGDYADEVSNISIPVTAGGDTISVGTTVQPSEVTVTYKGWHPVTDVHERENGAWT